MSAAADPRFADGAKYDRLMGKWSVLAGVKFLNWLAAPSRLKWIDIGCGSGAFTELIVESCAPVSVDAIDPAEGQLAYARSRPGTGMAQFRVGDAMALPFADATFDAAVMALVIFFVPDPAKGVAEMVRVVRPGGLVTAYAWDATRGGAPIEVMWSELEAAGLAPPRPPSGQASRMENLRQLWADAGLQEIETSEIVVMRSFVDFDEFWAINTATNFGPAIAKLAPDDAVALKQRVRNRLPADAVGRISFSARANAIKGRMPR